MNDNIMMLNDADWRDCVGAAPALILFTTGEGLRGDFSTQFKKSASENRRVIFAQIDPRQNPRAAEQFEVGEKPVLVGWYRDKELVRRAKPWGTDVVLALELLEKTFADDAPPATAGTVIPAEPTTKEKTVVETKPFIVTDQTFQKEVIDYSLHTPVLVDFWAEWCGPCRMVAPIMEKLAAEFAGQVRIAKVDTDKNQGVSGYFRIMSIPTIMAFKQGQLVFNQAGAFPEPAFRDLIQQLIALQIPAKGEAAESEEGEESVVEE